MNGCVMSGRVIWITGRPAAGKSTLATLLASELENLGHRVVRVDSDEVRSVITPNPRYTPEEREIVYRSIAYTALRLAQAGSVVIVAATAHDDHLRAIARGICPGMLLVYAQCSPNVCERRDPKGLYRRARQASASTLPGVGMPFEEPKDADVVVDTETNVPSAILRNTALFLSDFIRRDGGTSEPHR